MAIHVIQSQSIEVLVQGLLQNTVKPSKNPFAVLQTQHFIVPSPAVQEWLTQKIAEQQGISANSFSSTYSWVSMVCLSTGFRG